MTTSLASHRVELVTGQPIRLHCIACGRELSNVDAHHPKLPRAYADLDGKPFVDYYDAECARKLGANV